MTRFKYSLLMCSLLKKKNMSTRFFKLYYNKFFGDLLYRDSTSEMNFKHYSNRSLLFEGYFFGMSFFFSFLLELPRLKFLHSKLFKGCFNVYYIVNSLILEPFFRLNVYKFFFLTEYFRIQQLNYFLKTQLKFSKKIFSKKFYRYFDPKLYYFSDRNLFSLRLTALLQYFSPLFFEKILPLYNYFYFFSKFYNFKKFRFLGNFVSVTGFFFKFFWFKYFKLFVFFFFKIKVRQIHNPKYRYCQKLPLIFNNFFVQDKRIFNVTAVRVKQLKSYLSSF